MKGATQEFLEVDQIREGIIVLKNKTLRGVLMVSSTNFALKSANEQNAIVYQFQSFLNSLDFSAQIVIQSRRLNITGYLDQIKALEKQHAGELMKTQIKSYYDFIKQFIEAGHIMTKEFFVVIPYSPTELYGVAAAKKALKTVVSLTEEDFQRCKVQLWQRMEFAVLGLKRMGLQAIPLNTLELTELFWRLHHPSQAEHGYYPEIPPELTL
ncbi:MAG: hypothetical protein A2667_02465 [Candidatus Wildermuthbacteria bacterium RIFCSPHIGHO2_01_FULL_47_27]|uniref:TraC-like domain-containing protein n=1 Tax=Candidatus Wildermuthbacteria bacterium RIFCSPLOWO2_01_FULL_48_35 TaxID=1802463 RepID=A0A1G2RNT1_9BACT|nr:MAG: hypothetical protein UY15_C0005G0026 [Parcubacteria group bacterium GW2011_GWA2_47_9]OHA63592.1 MAG: hypothetical protein A2667_02465 [Candidatus Wildermuthbacteria bacterium RIFCSPHIGHO2_01_FULL_47_27]OHA74128.1 MAG: hypothetical protein A3A32_00335 [Candidatus Wildermuthbacteria bacterium RIFCSPLOWO2_01_FULL_48_35]OHA75973.1 MAG: hypothetical protein A3I38_03000 [Candidatus Wildermuthbacteria bacterium RIFCSPLOWO2_02_FULL_47_10]